MCDKCKLVITFDEISCNGFCNGKFHYSCAELDRTVHKQCLRSRNFLWFCNDCKDLLLNKSFKKLFREINILGPRFLELLEKLDCNKVLCDNLIDRLSCMENAFARAATQLPVAAADTKTFSSPSHHTADVSVPVEMLVSTPESLPTMSSNLAISACDSNINPSMGSTNCSETVACHLYAAAADNDSSSSSNNHTFNVPVSTEVMLGASGLPPFNSSDLSYASCVTMTADRNPHIEPTDNSSKLSTSCMTVSAASSASFPATSISSTASAANRDLTVTSHHVRQLGGCGTNTIPVNITIKTAAPMFWLHLSKFDPRTSEEDVLSMAYACLGPNTYKVRKLVPKNNNDKVMEYVCFKLGIGAELREKALIANTWPTGVLFRPFTSSYFRIRGPNRAKDWPPVATASPQMI